MDVGGRPTRVPRYRNIARHRTRPRGVRQSRERGSTPVLCWAHTVSCFCSLDPPREVADTRSPSLKDSVEEGEEEAVLEMPHEVEERYLKLLRRQGKAKGFEERRHAKKRGTHKVMKVSSGYLKGSPLMSPR